MWSPEMRKEPLIGVTTFGTDKTTPFTTTAILGETGLVVAASILGEPVGFNFTSKVGIAVEGTPPPMVSTFILDEATPIMSAFVTTGGVTRWMVAPDEGSIAGSVFGPAFVDVAKISILPRGVT